MFVFFLHKQNYVCIINGKRRTIGIQIFVSQGDCTLDRSEITKEYLEEQEQLALDNVKYRKSSRLVQAKNGRTNIWVHRLFTIAISEAKVDKKTGQAVAVVSGQRLRKIFKSNSGSFYESLKSACSSPSHKADLMSWRLGMENPQTQEFSYINVVSKAEFKDGTLTVQFTPEVTKEISSLKSNYGEFYRAITLSFTSAYSIVLYERLSSQADYLRSVQHSNGPYFIYYTIEELRDMFTLDYETMDPSKKNRRVIAHAYSRFADMHKFVLIPSIEEINASPIPFSVTYKLERGGRGAKITGITFTVIRKPEFVTPGSTKKGSEITEEEKKRRKLVFADVSDLFTEEDLSIKDMRSICEAAGYDLDRIKKAYDASKDSPNISNFTGWMITAVKEGYQPGKCRKTKAKTSSKSKKSRNSFTDFEQNEYDFEELEKQLLHNS